MANYEQITETIECYTKTASEYRDRMKVEGTTSVLMMHFEMMSGLMLICAGLSRIEREIHQFRMLE